MQLHFAPLQNYDCVQCGRSCQAGWDIPVEPHVQAQIEGHSLTLRVIQERGSAFLEKKGQTVLNMTPGNPRCGFLEPDLLCGLHRHLGVTAKPTTCRLFPLIISQAPDGYHVGVSYSCTGVRQNSGRPLQAQKEEVESLIQAGASINLIPRDGLPVHANWFVDYDEYLTLEKSILLLSQQSSHAQAIAQSLWDLAGTLAAQPRPRTSSPRPLAAGLLLQKSSLAANPVHLRAMVEGLWGSLAEQLGPELESVEPALRQSYLAATRELDGCSADQINRHLFHPLPPALQVECERYLAHMLHRKQLVIHPTLLSNLCLLYFLPHFLSLYSHAFARQRQRDIQLQDYYDALDLAEKFLVYHCRGLRPLYQKAAQALLRHIQGEARS